jgi:hypothetical protein
VHSATTPLAGGEKAILRRTTNCAIVRSHWCTRGCAAANEREIHNLMRRSITTIGTAVTAVALSASVALAAGGVSGTAKGHGQAVSAVAKAADYVSGKARGEAVSALAKQHGAAVSAAAKAQGQANAAAGKAKGDAKSAAGQANGDDASEQGRLKSESGT